VLVAGKDAVILDFEGEPLRSLAERRAKHCALRDVAGILRSLSYAAETAARRLPPEMPPDTRHKAEGALERWRLDASRSFAKFYFAAAQGLRSIPADRVEAGQLLKLFLLEKALYEITYELANRPDWVSIPLRGVISLLREAGEVAG
jgi:trehalose synthase-fused probable maltokinase